MAPFIRHIGTALDIKNAEQSFTDILPKDRLMITHQSSSLSLGIGSLAFLAGVFATIVTAYAMVARRGRTIETLHDHYDGWEEGLGV